MIFETNLDESKLAFVMVMKSPSTINLLAVDDSTPRLRKVVVSLEIPFIKYISKSCNPATSAVLPHTPFNIQPFPWAVS